MTFAAFIGRWQNWHLPGASFVLASVLMLAALVTAWRATRHQVVAQAL